MAVRARVLYIANSCRPKDAAWISTFYVLKALKLTGMVESAIVITNDPEAVRVKDLADLKGWVKIRYVPIARFLRSILAYVFIFLVALKVVKENRITHIFTQHHNFHMASFTGALIARLLGRACIIKIQDGIPYIKHSPIGTFLNRSIMLAINKLAFKWADLILNLSPERASLISKIFNVHETKMLLLPNLIDLGAFSEPDDAFGRAFKERYGLDGHKILLFVGSTVERGLEKLIRALPTIISKMKVKLIILSRAPDRKLMELAKFLGVKDHVVFAESIEHRLVPSVISLADLCVGPLLVTWFTFAGAQRKVIEYMACGKPFVAAKWAVSRSLLVNGITGIAINNPDDARELAEKITGILADEARREELGRNAKEIVRNLYDCNSFKVISQLRNVLLSSLKPKS